MGVVARPSQNHFSTAKAKANLKKLSWRQKRQIRQSSRLVRLTIAIKKIAGYLMQHQQNNVCKTPVQLVGQRPVVDANIVGTSLQLLVDSGSMVNILSRATLSDLERQERFPRIKNNFKLKDQSGNEIPSTEAVLIPVKFESLELLHSF